MGRAGLAVRKAGGLRGRDEGGKEISPMGLIGPMVRKAESERAILERGYDAVERGARAEGGGGFFVVGAVVAADVGGFALDGDELVHDLFFGGAEFFGEGFEDRL